MVIIEYIPHGDLLGFLRKSRGLEDTYYKDPDVKPKTNLTPQQLMTMAWQVSDGMNYLFSKKVIKLLKDNTVIINLEKSNISCSTYNFALQFNDIMFDITFSSEDKLKFTCLNELLYNTLLETNLRCWWG